MHSNHHLKNEPIFILGNPRSGTTMFRLMLTSHKNIVIPPECGFAAWLYSKYKEWNYHNDKSILHNFIQDVLNSRKFETWNLNQNYLTDFILKYQPNSYQKAVSAVYECYGSAQNKSFKRWGDKNNFYIDYIPALVEMFPNAFFIHLVRDGRNIACSYIQLNQRKIDSKYVPRLPSDIQDIANEWKQNINKINNTLIGFKNINFYEIRFEDLILNTEQSLSQLCEWLQEDFDPLMLQYYKLNENNLLEPKEFLKWKAKTLKPPLAKEVNRYQQELTVSDRQLFETIARQELMRYHYPLS